MYTNRDSKEKAEDRDGYSQRTYLIMFVIALVIFIATTLMAWPHKLDGWQLSVFREINNLNFGSTGTTIAKWVSEGLGAGYAIAACVLIPLFFKRFKLAWRFFVIAGGTTAVFYVIKKMVNEPRPIAMLHGNLHQRVVETGPGFPSGHETAATALALTLWIILPSRWRWICAVWCLTVAFSRLYLGVHTPGDVFGGFAIGYMAVCFLRLLPHKFLKKVRLDTEHMLSPDW